MADFRLSANIIKRSVGQSSVAAAAYRSGSRFEDERTGITHDYTKKFGVVHSEILAPDKTPDWMFNRAELWNAVEKVERRKDAQLAREIQLSLPHELTDEQRLTLVRDFVQEQFVNQGMIADIAIHHPDKQSDDRNHHAHVMLTMRELSSDGFGKKNRDWNSPDNLQEWRHEWANHQNHTLERHGHSARVDHRSLEEQGIDREPQSHMGQKAHNMEQNGKQTRVGNNNRDIAARNAKRAQNRAELALLNVQIIKERRELERYSTNRTAKVSDAGNKHQATMAERHAQEKQKLTEKLHHQNAVFKNTVSRELETITTRLNSAKGFKKLLRTAIGKTRSDEHAKAELGAALSTIKQFEAREIKQLEKTHKLEAKRGNERIKNLKNRVSQAVDRRRSQLDTKHEKQQQELQKRLFKENSESEPATLDDERANAIAVNDNGRASGLSKNFSQKNKSTKQQKRQREAGRQQGRDGGRGPSGMS